MSKITNTIMANSTSSSATSKDAATQADSSRLLTVPLTLDVMNTVDIQHFLCHLAETRRQEPGEDTEETNMKIDCEGIEDWTDGDVDETFSVRSINSTSDGNTRGLMFPFRHASKANMTGSPPQLIREDTTKDYLGFSESLSPLPMSEDIYPETPIFPVPDLNREETMQSTIDDGERAPLKDVLREPINGNANIDTSGPDPRSLLLFRELEDGTAIYRYEPKTRPSSDSDGSESSNVPEASSSSTATLPNASQAGFSSSKGVEDQLSLSQSILDDNATQITMLLAQTVRLISRVVDTEEKGLCILKEAVALATQAHHREPYIPNNVSRFYDCGHQEDERRHDHHYSNYSVDERLSTFSDAFINDRHHIDDDYEAHDGRHHEVEGCSDSRQGYDESRRRYRDLHDDYGDRHGRHDRYDRDDLYDITAITYNDRDDCHPLRREDYRNSYQHDGHYNRHYDRRYD